MNGMVQILRKANVFLTWHFKLWSRRMKRSFIRICKFLVISLEKTAAKMGQTFSNLWRCIRSKQTRETKKTLQDDQLDHLIDPLQQQQQSHHVITIPDDLATGEVSSSIPRAMVDYLNDQKNDEIEEGYYVEQVSTPVVLQKEVVVKNAIPDNVYNNQHVSGLIPNNRDSRDGCTSNKGQNSKFATKVSTKSPSVEAREFEVRYPVPVPDEVIIFANKEMPIKRIGQYTSNQLILLVGEGNFSFSASLAVAFGSASNIIATSLNSQDFLMENYSMFRKNKIKIESRGGTLFHDVDAISMVKHPVLGNLKFDRIVFNFPHTGQFTKTDSDLRKQKELVRGFLRNAKKMIREDGEIHITHKSNGFFLEWNLPKIGSDQGLCLIQEMKFRQNMYPGYSTKYGFGGDKDLYCNPCKTYKFGLPPK